MAGKRVDIVTIAQKGVFTSKPRPAIVVQASSQLEAAPAVVVCLIAGDPVEDPPFFRIDIEPTVLNGLTKPSQIMADLPIPILLKNVRPTKGVAEADIMTKLNTALTLYLELG